MLTHAALPSPETISVTVQHNWEKEATGLQHQRLTSQGPGLEENADTYPKIQGSIKSALQAVHPITHLSPLWY